MFSLIQAIKVCAAPQGGVLCRFCLESGVVFEGTTGLYERIKVARLDFLGGYLPSLSINYVAMSKDMGKRLPQLYYIKMKISYDLGFIAIGVAIAT